MSLASAQTQIQLVLRNPLDHEVTKTPGTALALLFNGGKLKSDADAGALKPRAPRPIRCAEAHTAAQPALAAAPKKEEPFVMEILSGTKKAELKFTHGAGRANKWQDSGKS